MTMIADVSPLALSSAANEAQGTRDWYGRWKPRMDTAFAAVLLVLTGPVIALAVVLVRLTSRGPAIYQQTRLCKGGCTFTIYKIRTMYHDAERQSGIIWSRPGDARVTPVGRFLRATHLDELPQLLNIFRG